MTCFVLKTGENLRQYCLRNGICYWTIVARIEKLGLLPDEALSWKYNRKQRCTHFVKSGETLAEACKREGVLYHSALKRVLVNKDDPDKAIENLKIFAMYKEMVKRAKEAGVDLTKVTRKIAAARVRFGLDILTCPCAKDDKDRGCISAKCLREIQENGICHCGCYCKR